MSDRTAWILDAVRTPVGRYGGALAGVRPDDLAAIALTAHVNPEDVEEALASGFQMHVAKPVDSSKLLSAVTTTLLRNLPN